MPHQVFSNNAQNATLAAPIGPGSNALTLNAGQGALFPATLAGQFFVATLTSATNPNQVPEIVRVNARVGDTFTGLTRGFEAPGPAQNWNAGDFVSMNPTAESMAQMVQPDVLQAQSTNFVQDTGAANAYIGNLNPPLAGHVVGMPIRFFAEHTNTGPSTFNDGIGTASIRFSDGTVLSAGVIVAGLIYEVVWVGAENFFELIGGGYVTPSGLAFNIAVALQFAVLQSQNGWFKLPTSVAGRPMIFQWGLFVGANAGAGFETIPLNIAYPNSHLIAEVNSNRALTGTVGTDFTSSLTLNNFGAVLDRNPAGNRAGYWYSLGY